MHHQLVFLLFHFSSESFQTQGQIRGMLPIRTVTFALCSVPVVKNEIDPKFLDQFSYIIEAKDDGSGPGSTAEAEETPQLDHYGSELPDTGEPECGTLSTSPLTEEIIQIPVHSSDVGGRIRRSRQSLLKAKEKLKKIVNILKSQGQVGSKADDDDDFDAAFPELNSSSRKQKSGRPCKKTHPSSKIISKVIKTKDSLKCDLCPREFLCKSQMAAHSLAHQRQLKKDAGKPFKCPACPFRFTRKENLRRHYNLHLDKNPFTCYVPNCNAKLSSAYNLRRHELMLHEGGSDAFRVKCTLCPAILARMDLLAR